MFTQIQFLMIHGLFAPCPPGVMDGNRDVTNKDGLLASVWGRDIEQPRASHVVVRSNVNGYHNLCHIPLRWDCGVHYTDNTCRNTFLHKTSKYVFPQQYILPEVRSWTWVCNLRNRQQRPLTHLSLDKMVAIWQTTFLNPCFWMATLEFRFIPPYIILATSINTCLPHLTASLYFLSHCLPLASSSRS